MYSSGQYGHTEILFPHRQDRQGARMRMRVEEDVWMVVGGWWLEEVVVWRERYYRANRFVCSPVLDLDRGGPSETTTKKCTINGDGRGMYRRGEERRGEADGQCDCAAVYQHALSKLHQLVPDVQYTPRTLDDGAGTETGIGTGTGTGTDEPFPYPKPVAVRAWRYTMPFCNIFSLFTSRLSPLLPSSPLLFLSCPQNSNLKSQTANLDLKPASAAHMYSASLRELWTTKRTAYISLLIGSVGELPATRNLHEGWLVGNGSSH